MGSYEPIGVSEDVKKKSEQAARVRLDETTLESDPITMIPRSLMNILSNFANYMLRLYVLLAPDELEKRSGIKKRIREDLVSRFLSSRCL